MSDDHFLGTEHFQGIDAELFGDGQGYEECDDALAAHLLQQQGMWLERFMGPSASHRWRTSFDTAAGTSGEKTFSSTEWLCVADTTWYVTPNTARLDIALEKTVGTHADSSNAYLPQPPSAEVRIELVGFGEVEVELTGGATYTHQPITLELTTRPQRTTPTRLRIWIRGSAAGYVSDGGGVNVRTRSPLEQPLGGLLVGELAMIPNASQIWEDTDNMTAQAIGVRGHGRAESLVQFTPGAMEAVFPELEGKIARELQNLGPGQTYTPIELGGVAVWPTPPSIGVESYETLISSRYHQSYVQLRAYDVRAICEPVTPPVGALRPHTTVKGSSFMGQLLRAKALNSRPVPHILHPDGERYEVDVAEGNVVEERFLHIRANGENTPSLPIGYQALRRTVKVREPGGLLVVEGWMLPYFAADGFESSATTKATQQDLQKAAARLSWNWRAQITSPGTGPGGNSTLLLDYTQSVELDHIPTSIANTYPLLTQLHWRYFADDTRRHPTLKEGALYDIDFGLLQPFRLELSLDAMTLTERDRPLDLQVAIEPVGGIVAGEAGNDAPTPSLSNAAICITSLSVWSMH